MAAAAPIVESCSGRLRGATSAGIHVFKGIRYAESTSGANRFLPPQPVIPWAGVRDALAPGASAPQFAVPHHTDPFYRWYSKIEPISEDCLFLNVFSPGLDDARRPVLFWIHGGGWREFAGTAPGFDGTALAREGDVVVVTINHRLNGFGFLRIEDTDERFADAANAGMLDVVAALEWVRDNIASFGGDPLNVTLFGESGGASKIAAILALHPAHGLFHKAIMQSSAGGMHLAEPEEAAGTAASLARELGLARVDGAALQKVPMAVLVETMRRTGGAFRGSIDGRSFGAHPFAGHASSLSVNIPLLAGCTNTETTYYLRGDDRNFALGFTDVTRRLARFLRRDSASANSIVGHYRAIYPSLDASRILVAITSDFVFKRNTYAMAAMHAAIGAPTYAFLFERESSVEGGRMGSCHTSEVPFVFGTTDAARSAIGEGHDIVPMTRRMMATWCAFARTGNSSNPTVPAWTPYSEAQRHTMVLNLDSRLEDDPGGAARAALDGEAWFGYGHALIDFCRD
ncbi:MAG: carboxylesterase/lipase family protein [Rhodospirillales bacterium]|nr:carboxylesterase/lipase family protein [Rhodospirillales bacterium]